MKRFLIPQPVRLAFDPATIDDPELRRVIANSMAWLIWCLWKPSHVTSQYFNQACLIIARSIDERNPKSIAEMCLCFDGHGDFPFGDVREWMQEAYLYLIGTLELRLEVIS